MSKSTVEVRVGKGGGEIKTYNGRFLGFLTDDEFNALVQNLEDVASRLECKETKPLLPLARKTDVLPGTRFVIAVRKIDGEEVMTKHLFVSPRLDYITSVEGNQVSIELKNSDKFIVLEEEAK